MIVLRDYQQDIVGKINNAWKAGNKNVLAVLPTGAGKSVVVSEIVNQAFLSHERVAVIAHRNELVSQMACHIARRGIPHRIVGALPTVSQIIKKERDEFGQSYVNPSANVAVVGVDTLVSRQDTMTEWAKQVDLWIIDEAHHLTVKNKWGKAVQMFENARGLGVTATPQRADGMGLGSRFDGYMDVVLVGPSTRELIKRECLSDFEIVCPASDLRVDDLKVSADGDWSSKELKKAAKKSKIVGDIVENYRKYCATRKGIVFATDIETAGDIANSFNESGIKACSVNGKSAQAYREQCINLFAKGDMQVLVNVDLFDEGFDVPACDVCVMARPTASLGKYLQMVGRALRPSPGKTALIVDHVSNVLRHGLPDKNRTWSLKRRDKKAKQEKDPDEIELTVCPKCLKPYEKFRVACPYCGEEKPLPPVKSRTIEIVAGDLVLLDKEKLEQLRNSTALQPATEVASKAAYATGKKYIGISAGKKQSERIVAQKQAFENIAQWAGYQRAAGFTDREIHKKFYLTIGCDMYSALSNDKSKQDFLDIAETVKGWYKNA